MSKLVFDVNSSIHKIDLKCENGMLDLSFEDTMEEFENSGQALSNWMPRLLENTFSNVERNMSSLSTLKDIVITDGKTKHVVLVRTVSNGGDVGLGKHVLNGARREASDIHKKSRQKELLTSIHSVLIVDRSELPKLTLFMVNTDNIINHKKNVINLSATETQQLFTDLTNAQHDTAVYDTMMFKGEPFIR